MNTTRTEEKARIRKEKARKVPMLNNDFQAQKHLVKKIWSFLGIRRLYSSLTDDSSTSATRGTTAWFGTTHTACMASVPLDLANHPTLVVLDPGCTRSIGPRAAIKKVPETCAEKWHYDGVLPLQ